MSVEKIRVVEKGCVYEEDQRGREWVCVWRRSERYRRGVCMEKIREVENGCVYGEDQRGREWVCVWRRSER